jgi:hypothetical protein
MTNADVISLIKSGLATDIIVAKIKSAPEKSFDTSVEGLKVLKDEGVPALVVHLMICGKEENPSSTSIGSNDGDTGSSTEPIKSGLWVGHGTLTQDGKVTEQPDTAICLGKTYDFHSIRQNMIQDLSKQGCTATTTATDPAKTIVVADCDLPTSHMATKLTMEQRDNEHVGMNTTMSMSGGGNSLTYEIAGEMVYSGSCPPGMDPGDRRDPNGTIHHISDQTEPDAAAGRFSGRQRR